MEFLGIEQQVSYCWEAASIFSLTPDEQAAVRTFEEEKSKIRASLDRQNASNDEREANWEELQRTLEIVDPIIHRFFATMPFYESVFDRYGKSTDYGEGFSVHTNPVAIVEEGKDVFCFIPRFSFEPQERTLECSVRLGKNGTEVLYYAYYPIDVLIDALQHAYGPPDGIKKPIVENAGSTKVVSVTHTPLVLQDLREVYTVMGPERVNDLEELRSAILDEERRSLKKRIVLATLKEKYRRALRECCNPESYTAPHSAN